MIAEKTQSQNSVLMTIAETSCFMRISKASLYRHIKAGKIQSLRAGRKLLFSKEAIDNFLTKPNDR